MQLVASFNLDCSVFVLNPFMNWCHAKKALLFLSTVRSWYNRKFVGLSVHVYLDFSLVQDYYFWLKYQKVSIYFCKTVHAWPGQMAINRTDLNDIKARCENPLVVLESKDWNGLIKNLRQNPIEQFQASVDKNLYQNITPKTISHGNRRK